MWSTVRACTLTGLAKTEKEQLVGLRPIAVGETILKIGCCLLLDGSPHLKSTELLGEFQYAMVSAGAEKIIHKLRDLYRNNPNAHMILLDCKNAFNVVLRQKILELLWSDPRLAALRPIFQNLYMIPGDLHVRTENSQTEGCPIIKSTEGVRQGDRWVRCCFVSC